jgi:hypothetical protein
MGIMPATRKGCPYGIATGLPARRGDPHSGLESRGEPGLLRPRLAPMPWPDIPQRLDVRLPHQEAFFYASL